MDKGKKVLLAWSGGLDSTYMLEKLLREGRNVDFLYIELENNAAKVVKEEAAISAMMELINKEMPDRLTRLLNAKLATDYGNHLLFKQAPVWLINLFLVADYDKYDSVAISYVLGDDVIAWIPDLKRIWNALAMFSEGHKLPKLTFPLIKTPKTKIWNTIDPSFRKLVTWCEFGNDLEDCNCHACRRAVFEGLVKNVATPAGMESKTPELGEVVPLIVPNPEV